MGVAADLFTLPPPQRRLWLAGEEPDDRASVFALVKNEYGTPYYVWHDDPVGFIGDCLGETMWSSQEHIARSVRDNRRTACPACHGPGKAVKNGTPVLTPNGWRKIEDLTVGDEVIAADGTATAVVGVYPQGVRDLYRIRFTDGTTIDADGDHLWGVLRRRGPQRGQVVVRSTAELFALCGPEPVGWGRPEIPSVAPVEFPATAVPLDPYLLGVLLGDGCLAISTPTLSTADPEILERIGHADARPTRTRPYDYPLLGISAAVRAAGIVGLRSWEKHVPDVYLWNAPDVRLAVLRGLCDTDGSVDDRDGSVEFTTTSTQLADDVTFLARSLGAQVRSASRFTTYEYGGERRQGRRSYRLRIIGGPCPFALTRKADRWNRAYAKRTATTNRLIVSIEPIEPAPATCIAVAHPSALFVIDQFVVTHNTWVAGQLVAWWMSVWPQGSAKAVTTAHTWKQVRNLLWPHITTTHRQHGLPGRVNQTEWVFDNTVYAWGFSPSKYDEAAGQGIHAEHLLVIVDEAGGIDPVLGSNLNSLMTGDARLLAIGNPPTEDESGWFESVCESGLWHTIRIDAFSTPNFTAEGDTVPEKVRRQLVDKIWVDETREHYGEDSAYWVARVLAQFPKLSSSRAIPVLWVERAMENETPARSGWQRLGVDVADGGGDEMVVAHADGWTVSVLEAWAGADTADQVVNAERVLEHIRYAEGIQQARGYTERKVRVKIDAIGVGAGTADVLTRMGKDGLHNADIVHVKVSETASDPGRFLRRRDECWWNVRELCRDGTLRLNINELQKAQLCGPLYGTDAAGRTVIESKKAMKARGLPSPDHADGIGLAVYEPETIVPAQSYGYQVREAQLPRSVGGRRQ